MRPEAATEPAAAQQLVMPSKDGKSRQAFLKEPLLRLPAGYKSTTDHEEDEDEEEGGFSTDALGQTDAESNYVPPEMSLNGDVPASRSSRSLTRLPPRAANPTLFFAAPSGRRHTCGNDLPRSRHQNYNRKHRHHATTPPGSSPTMHPLAWPQRSASSNPDGHTALRCTSYCCAHALGLVELDRWLHTRGVRGEWYKDGLNAVLHCVTSCAGVTELCRAPVDTRARRPSKASPAGAAASPSQKLLGTLVRSVQTGAGGAAGAGAGIVAAARVVWGACGRTSDGRASAPPATASAPAPAVQGTLPAESEGVARAQSDPMEALGSPPRADDDEDEDDADESERFAAQPAHAFFFSYGCVVLFGLSEELELQLIATLKRDYAQEPLLTNEVDDFGYVHATNAEKMVIHKDLFRLSTATVSEKLAVAFALAQSAKLGVFEVTVEQTIQNTRSIPEKMARDGKISLNRAQITKQIGQLFVDRASINLHSDILDNPDFFWEDDEWLPAYSSCSKYLEITRRAEVLNKRLDIIKELFDMLASEYHNSHASMLEWIVIVLILVEVFFQVLELLWRDHMMPGTQHSSATLRVLSHLSGTLEGDEGAY